VLFIGSRCYPRHLRAFGHPGIADLGRQTDVQFIGKDHSLRALELFKGHPEGGQTLDAAGIVVFGDQVGELPHLADLMGLSPHGLHRNRQAPCVLQGQG
jgi:hypothetical protein